MRYRKPRTINLVSFMLLGAAGLFVYLAVCFWPVYSTRSRVRGILLDHVPLLYKANLRPTEVTQAMLEDIKTSIRAEIQKAGINEKAVKIYLRHNVKEIELEARLKARAHFPWPDKTFEFDIAPKVVSDATRVDW
jgi:hypothetical protein